MTDNKTKVPRAPVLQPCFGSDEICQLTAIELLAAYKSGEISETLKLIKENLIITRSFPSGTEQKWNLEPYWTKVEILNPRINQYNLIIKSKEKVVMIGSFLNYYDNE